VGAIFLLFFEAGSVEKGNRLFFGGGVKRTISDGCGVCIAGGCSNIGAGSWSWRRRRRRRSS